MIARSTASLRERSRITARKSAGDYVQISENRVPSTVGAGDTFEIGLDFAINAETNPLDPDYCITRAGDISGVRLDAEVLIGGRFISADQFCMAQAPGGGYGGTRTISKRVTAPSSPGEYELWIQFSGANSGHAFGEYRTTITVEAESSGGDGGGDGSGDDEFTPDDDDTDPDDQTCSGLVDALTKQECSVNAYFQNAGQGAMMTLGIGAIAFLALSAR